MINAYTALISTEELQRAMTDGNPVVLDCTYYLSDFDKGRKEYLQQHIPGAFFLDLGLDLSSPVIKGVTGRHPLPDPQVLTYTLRACGINEDSQVVAYDQSNGVYASRAWWLLNWLGHAKVAILNGGFGAWKMKGYATDNQWPPPANGNLVAHLRTELRVTKEEVTSLKNTLVDSREYKRYTGEFEPIDPVAGHIPGAICIPYTDNVDEKGYWKPKDFFLEKFKSLTADPSTPPVFYCGSGVTACHNLFAYKSATGLDGKLYNGSWSEWINYFPIATGG